MNSNNENNVNDVNDANNVKPNSFSSSLHWDQNGCPVCKCKDITVFLNISNIPTQDGVVWPTEQEALNSPVGDIELVYCKQCQYIGNQKYTTDNIQFVDYDFSLHYSPYYQKFIHELAQELVARNKLYNKTIIDIGCGKGHFLDELCQIGKNKGIGIDPSFEQVADVQNNSESITFIKDYYSPKYSDLRADFIACRHVIDELDAPLDFVNMMKDSLSNNQNAIVYIEVPNALNTFSHDIIWNIGYAKRSWFTADSLSNIFKLNGFDVINVQTCLNDEYLGIEIRPTPEQSSNTTGSIEYFSGLKQTTQTTLNGFSENFHKVVAHWKNVLDKITLDNKKLVVWGAGMRAINFLNMFDIKSIVPYVVDINPTRQEKYLPRSGYKVLAPEALKKDPPDVLLISNPTYAEEIKAQALELGLTDCEFLVL